MSYGDDGLGFVDILEVVSSLLNECLYKGREVSVCTGANFVIYQEWVEHVIL